MLTPTVLFVVLGSGVLHAIWNAVAKSLDDRVLCFAGIGIASTVAGAAALGVTGLPGHGAVVFALVSAAVHIVYDLALMRSYRLGSFNVMYPVARGTSPLVIALGALVFANEHLPALGLAGVCVLAAGLLSLAVSAGRIGRSDVPALVAAVVTGLLIATYSLIDGIGARHSGDPMAYAALLFVAQGPVFGVVAAATRPPRELLRDRALRLGAAAGILTVVAYAAVIWAQTKAPLAEVAALRETGVISAAVIGAWFFKEGFGGRRLAAAILVALGILLIGI